MTLRHWAAFLLLASIWGSSFLWIKLAVQEIDPLTLVGFRLLFGALGLSLVVAMRRPSWPRDMRTWRTLLTLGLTNTAIPFVLISWGEIHIDSGVASILNGAVPLFTLLIAHWFLHDERITWLRSVGLLVGFSGVFVLLSRDLALQGDGMNVLGQLAVLGATLCYAGSSVFARRNLRSVPPMLQALVIVLTADTAIWLSMLLFDMPFRAPTLPVTWVSLAWLGLLGSCLAYLLYFSLIQSVGSTRTVLVTYAMPVIGVILGVVVLSEPLDWHLVAGTALVASGIWAVNRRVRAPAQMAQDAGQRTRAGGASLQ